MFTLPNIVVVATITAKSAVVNLSTVATASGFYNRRLDGKVFKVNSLCRNVDGLWRQTTCLQRG